MRHYITLFLLLFNLISYANPDNKWQEDFKQANDYYQKEQYQKAIDSYLELSKTITNSSELYYNLANAYFKNKQDVDAVYYFEKALQLAPFDKEILTNLDHAKANLQDDITTIKKYNNHDVFHQAIGKLTPDNWAYTTTALAFVALLLFAIFYLASNSVVKRLSFTLLIIGVLAIGFTTYAAYFEQHYNTTQPIAMLWEDKVDLKEDPRSNSTTLLELHKGTKVYILQEKALWIKVRLDNLEQGWVMKKSVRDI